MQADCRTGTLVSVVAPRDDAHEHELESGAEAEAAAVARPLGTATPSRPTEPWVPRRLEVYPVSKARKTTRRGKKVNCWDLRWQIDGWWFSRRFTHPEGTAGQAGTWAERLNSDFANGLAFDPVARRFVAPGANLSPAVPTVFECSIEYVRRHWKNWEPKSRQAAVRTLGRACVHLLGPDAPQPPKAIDPGIQPLLRSRASDADASPVEPFEVVDFLGRWSMPISEVTWEQIEALDARYRHNSRSPDKEVAATTQVRFRADLGQFFAECSARGGFRDPFHTFQTITKASRRERASAGVSAVDADIVLSPSQVRSLAVCCARYGTWGPVVICFVMAMGLCGLRPGEAAGLRRRDLELPPLGPGWVTVGRSLRRVADHWLIAGEDRNFGPLKDRLPTETRRVLIPSWLVPLLRLHLELFCPGSGRHDLVFSRYDKPFDPSMFLDKVWRPARDALFPPDPELADDDVHQPKLSRLTPHALRHAACSLWLTAGVDFKVCQRWSGHKTLSIFLDVYSGILPGRDEEGVIAVETLLGATSSW